MATAAEARTLGFITPADSDFIRDGDDAITQNAITATELRTPRGRLAAGSNLLDLAEGVYTISNVNDAATMTPPLPEVFPGVLEVIGNHSHITSPLRVFRFSPHQKAHFYHAAMASFTAVMPWIKLSEAANMPVPTYSAEPLANSILMDEFTGAMGGRISTDGLGALAVRIDHGLFNFNSLIRGMLEARNIPYCIAIASRRWDASENAGVTPAMVNSWVNGGLCEIWNHGATAHDNVSGLAAIQDYWVNGKAELESQIPAAKIYGAILPGTGDPNAFDGLVGASKPEQIYGSTGGQVILGSHAIISGALPNTQLRVLDGTPRQGQSHAGIDSRSYADTTALINQARDQKRGLQLMLHPSRVNMAGDYNTAAQIEAILDYIVAERDAGRIKVLSPYQLMLADATI